MNKILHIIFYLFLLFLVIGGLYLAHTDLAYFEAYWVKEDGWIENLSAFLLFSSCILLASRSITYLKRHKRAAFFTTICLSLLFLFGAGEEISWGQRLFGVESSEFFKANNTQDEMNFHNLEWNGIKLNKLIFSQLLSIVLLFYLVIYKGLYHYIARIRSFNDYWGVPIPRWHHVLCLFLMAGLILLIPSGKKWEVLELVLSVTFFLIFLNPFNRTTLSL